MKIIELTPYSIAGVRALPTTRRDDTLTLSVGKYNAYTFKLEGYLGVRLYTKTHFWQNSSLYNSWANLLSYHPVLLRPEYMYRIVSWVLWGEVLPLEQVAGSDHVSPIYLSLPDYPDDRLGWYWLLWCTIVEASMVLKCEPPSVPPVWVEGRRVTMGYTTTDGLHHPTIDAQVRLSYHGQLRDEYAQGVVNNPPKEQYIRVAQKVIRKLNKLYCQQRHYVAAVEHLFLEADLCEETYQR